MATASIPELDSDTTEGLPGFAPTNPRRADPPPPATSSWDPSPEGPDLEPPIRPSSATTNATPGSSPASTAETEAGWAGLCVVPLTALGLVLNGRLDRGGELWIMDDQDLTSIATPAGRILARHVPVGDGQANDFVDAAEIAVGTAGYALKNIARTTARHGTTITPAPATEREPPAAPAPTPVGEDDGPVAPTEVFHPGAFHDHFPPP